MRLKMFLIDCAEFTQNKKQVVKSLNAALENLRQIGSKKHEGSFLFNFQNGKTGRYIRGDAHNVSPLKQLKTEPKVKRSILHNHPTNTSLSYSDLRVTGRNFIDQNFVVTPDGSKFRGYIKDKNAYDSFRDKYAPIQQYFEKKLIEQNPNLTRSDAQFLTSHEIMRRLKNKNVIHYRSKLTPTSVELYNKHKDYLQNLQLLVKK